ncbi:MAG: hypothetical protein V1750_01435 [Acidobacteriota bacterium]
MPGEVAALGLDDGDHAGQSWRTIVRSHADHLAGGLIGDPAELASTGRW